MKLYMFPIAPNPTKVRLFVAEKRSGGAEIPVEETTVNLVEGQQRSPEHRARHPFSILPVLETEAGEMIFESLAIMEYLEELYPDPPLFGSTPEERARNRQLERVVDLGVLIPIGRIVHLTNSPLGLPPDPDQADSLRPQLGTRLDYLESLLADGRPFLSGDSVTAADCTLAAALQFGRFRELDFISGHAALSRWDERYRARHEIAGILIA